MLVSLALFSPSSAAAQPAPLTGGGETVAIPLVKRSSASLTKRDGSVAWDRVQVSPDFQR